MKTNIQNFIQFIIKWYQNGRSNLIIFPSYRTCCGISSDIKKGDAVINTARYVKYCIAKTKETRCRDVFVAEASLTAV